MACPLIVVSAMQDGVGEAEAARQLRQIADLLDTDDGRGRPT